MHVHRRDFYLFFAPISMASHCVYSYIPHWVVSGATRATAHTRSKLPRVYVVDERKTYAYGMARHGTHIGAADTSKLVL